GADSFAPAPAGTRRPRPRGPPPAPRGDRPGPRAATPTATWAPGRQAARPLQPPASQQLRQRRRDRHPGSAEKPRPPRPSGNGRSRRARARVARPRPRARTVAARRARRRTDRGRATNHLLVTPRAAALRSLLRPARWRRTGPRVQWPNTTTPTQPRRRSPTEPRTAHDRAPPPPTRSSHPGLPRGTNRSRQE